MNIRHVMAATILACALGAGSAYGQGTTPAAPAKPAATEPKAGTGAGEDKAAVSARCSAEATKKGLHGKQRKIFRSKCKRGQS